VNQEESEQNEVDGMKGADSAGKVMHMGRICLVSVEQWRDLVRSARVQS